MGGSVNEEGRWRASARTAGPAVRRSWMCAALMRVTRASSGSPVIMVVAGSSFGGRGGNTGREAELMIAQPPAFDSVAVRITVCADPAGVRAIWFVVLLPVIGPPAIVQA